MTQPTENPVIVLTTDFGVEGAYAGVMKGVILSLNPRAKIIDHTHGISPQNVLEGAFVLGINHRYFPADAIHVAVVDPGVGTDRRPILAVTPRGMFLAPDNGLLTQVVWPGSDATPELTPGADPETTRETGGQCPLPPGCSAYELTDPRYWLHPVSATFHGRDVFSPSAAHLSLGVPPASLGRPVASIHRLAMPNPSGQLPGVLRGQVIHADPFGNLVSNIEASRLPQAAGSIQLEIEIKGRTIYGLSRTFHDSPLHSYTYDGLLALTGSHGYLEIAVRDGSAAQLLQAAPGEPVTVTLP